jgi:hypothetical protein
MFSHDLEKFSAQKYPLGFGKVFRTKIPVIMKTIVAA